MNNKEIQAIIEGILFIYGEEGISFSDLQNVLENEKSSAIKNAIQDLKVKYDNDEGSAFSIQNFGQNKFRLQTKPHLHEYFAKLEMAQSQSKLSNSSIEVLSIVAYKGPIAKSGIDEIRGVDSSYQVYKLKERNLIRVSGKSEEIGNANLYTITENFYKLFNLQGGLEVLPSIGEDELQNIIDENLAELDKNKEQNKNRDIFADEDDQVEVSE
ncbi:SMC-Scp complex subunit ScpB [[Acholeplasma] multilocale]|uniref:SMC-Scp complex subunit ScpB n=1 Tax=[Acholeplasma] multilocale TaxID=264638 RepID=UPI0004063407|nr:SMC-Scp complex subunit ScpB [[Acholeplasma] multilocale]